eukprot:TRINITY_DN1214_c1_g1_i1.p1 TRINITY_DN1214_c1_g1~~TRINITY_DN1214_c1_g1_i1.p1  ORF type:complete len:1454 (+),score=346.74 TRINITY_DN1214_c1_g1_i1:191-4552(+)
MFATKRPDTREALISRQVAATVGALSGILVDEDDGKMTTSSTVDTAVQRMGGVPDPYRHERDLDPHKIEAAVEQLASLSGPVKTVVGTHTLGSPLPPSLHEEEHPNRTEADNIETSKVQIAEPSSLSQRRKRRQMLKQSKAKENETEKEGDKDQKRSSNQGSKRERVKGRLRKGSSVKRIPSNESQNLGDVVEARPSEGGNAVAAATSTNNNNNEDGDNQGSSTDLTSDDETSSYTSPLSGNREGSRYLGGSKESEEKRGKLLARLIADLGRLEVLWTKCEDKQAVETHLRHNRGVARTMVQALKDFPDEPVVYIKVCSLLLMSWSGYGKGVLESREQFGSDTAGIKLLGKGYHRFSAWGEHPNSEAFEMIERTLSTFRVTYSSAITLPEINRKINKFIAKPLYKRKGLFLVDNSILGSECLWGSLHKEHQEVLKGLHASMPERCIITLHSIIGRGLSIKDRVRGSSDPYVKIQQYEWDQPPLPDEPSLWTSYIQHKTTDPEWMLEARNTRHTHSSWFHRSARAAGSNMFEARFNTNLKISIFDHDRLSHDDFMGRFELDPTVVWVLARALKRAREVHTQKEKGEQETEDKRIERKMSEGRKKAPSHMNPHMEHRRQLHQQRRASLASSGRKPGRKPDAKLQRSFSQKLHRQKFVLRKRAMTVSAYEFKKYRDNMLKAEDDKYETDSDDDDSQSSEESSDEIEAQLKKLRYKRQRSSQLRRTRRGKDHQEKLAQRKADNADSTSEEAEDEKDSDRDDKATVAPHGIIDIRTKSFGLQHGLPNLKPSEKGVPDASSRGDRPSKKTKDDVGNLLSRSDDSVIISAKGGEADLDDSDEEDQEESKHGKLSQKLKIRHRDGHSSSASSGSSSGDDSDDGSGKYVHHHMFHRSKTHGSEAIPRPNPRSIKSAVKSTWARLHYSAPTSASSGVDAFVPQSDGKSVAPEPGWDPVPKKELPEEEERKQQDLRADHRIMADPIDYTPPLLDDTKHNLDNGKPPKANKKKKKQISKSLQPSDANDHPNYGLATTVPHKLDRSRTVGTRSLNEAELEREKKKVAKQQKKREKHREKKTNKLKKQIAKQRKQAQKEGGSSIALSASSDLSSTDDDETDNVSDDSSVADRSTTAASNSYLNSDASSADTDTAHSSDSDDVHPHHPGLRPVSSNTASANKREAQTEKKKRHGLLSSLHRSHRHDIAGTGKRKHHYAWLHSDTVNVPPSLDTMAKKKEEKEEQEVIEERQQLLSNSEPKKRHFTDFLSGSHGVLATHHRSEQHRNRHSNNSNRNSNNTQDKKKSSHTLYLTHRKRVAKRGAHLNRSVQESVSEDDDSVYDYSDNVTPTTATLSSDVSDDDDSITNTNTNNNNNNNTDNDDSSSNEDGRHPRTTRAPSLSQPDRPPLTAGRHGKTWLTLVLPLHSGEELPAASPVREYFHKHITGTIKITLHVSDPYLREDKDHPLTM